MWWDRGWVALWHSHAICFKIRIQKLRWMNLNEWLFKTGVYATFPWPRRLSVEEINCSYFPDLHLFPWLSYLWTTIIFHICVFTITNTNAHFSRNSCAIIAVVGKGEERTHTLLCCPPTRWNCSSEGFCYGTEQLKGKIKGCHVSLSKKSMENPLGCAFEFAERGERKELISLSIFYLGFCCKLWLLLHYLSGWAPEPQKLIPEQTILACEAVWTQDATWQ